MSRTFRRDESGRKSQDTRRAKKREKSNSHWLMPETESYGKNKNDKNYRHFELDTDED